jgi:hypothetical protein
MGNKRNAYARLIKVENVRVVETKQIATTTRTIDATTWYLGSFIPTLLDDLFLTQI